MAKKPKPKIPKGEGTLFSLHYRDGTVKYERGPDSKEILNRCWGRGERGKIQRISEVPEASK